MARPGIRKEEVFSAANQILSQGKTPTIELIRQILKSGSNSTIAGHLRHWKATQQAGEAIAIDENIPVEFVNAAKELWERLKAQSEIKMKALEEEYAKALADAFEDLKIAKAASVEWERKHNQLMQAKAHLASENASLEQGIAFLHKEKVSLENKIDNQQQQLDDKQERIGELHRLHQQSQTNLEHFRESTREQRAIEQAQFEQQKIEMQQEIKQLKEMLIVAKDKTNAVQQDYKALEQSYTTLVQDYSKLETKYEKQTEQVADLRVAKQEHQQASKHFEKLYNQSQKALDSKTNQLIDTQSENRLLSQQLKDTQTAIKEQQDQVKHLGHEKWQLAQEKAQLEGRLREAEYMVMAKQK